MFRFTSPVTLQLQRGELIAWPSAAAATVKVVAGLAWITRCDDPDDHWLHAGQSIGLQRGARAVITAESDVVLRFETAPGWVGTLARSLRRLRPRLRPHLAAPG